MRIQSCLLALLFLAPLGCGETGGSSGAVPTTSPAPSRDASLRLPDLCNTSEECPAGQSCQDGTCTPSVPQCASDQDCMGGQVCDGGLCRIQSSDCSDNNPCPTGQSCDNGQCVSAGTSSGCQTDEECVNGRCLNGMCAPEPNACQRDAECMSGMTCEDGRCVPTAACMSHMDCGDGQRCVDGECVLLSGGCQNDAECGPNADCVNGACVAIDPCENCPPGTRCVNDRCVPEAMDECMRNADCGADMVCDAGTCVRANMNRCANDIECGAGSRCVNGECIPDEAECRRDDECGLGQECRNGACELAEGFADPCLDDEDCPANFQCTADICVPRVGEDECMADADCRAGERCDRGMCVAGGNAGLGAPCAQQADCADDLQCIDGLCVVPRAGCMNDRECAAGEICFRGECRDDPAMNCNNDFDCNGDRCIDGACVLPCVDNADCLFDQVCRDGGCVANDGGLPEADACVMPDAIRLGGRVQGSTANASANYAASCGNDAEGPEVVYEYRALQDGTVCATTRGSTFDTVLYIKTPTCAAGREIECNDDEDFPREEHSLAEFDVVAGQSYFIFVDGYGVDESGNYQLLLSDNPCD